MAYGIDARVLLAAELEGMLAEMPLAKVRVAQLCRRAGCSAPTFYYHFHDKYELAAWIFVRDFASAYADREPGYDVDAMDKALANIERRRAFYETAWEDHSQNSVAAYMHAFTMEMTADAVRGATGVPMSVGQALVAEYHTFGMIALTMKWVAGGLDVERYALAELLVERTPDFIAEAMKGYAFRSAELLARVQKTPS